MNNQSFDKFTCFIWEMLPSAQEQETRLSNSCIDGSGNINIVNTGGSSASEGGMGSGGGTEEGAGVDEKAVGDKDKVADKDDNRWDPLRPKDEKGKE